MKWILLILFMTSICQAKTIRVAVIDTGIERHVVGQAKLCPSGHRSFVPGTTIEDRTGHGTNVAGLIQENAKDADFCMIIIKFYDSDNSATNSLQSLVQSLNYAVDQKVDIINFSGGGGVKSLIEQATIERIVKERIILIVSAGNKNEDLDKSCNYFPACYNKRIWVIGSLDVPDTNKGKVVDAYLSGKDKTGFGITMSGTSQATAIFTGRAVNALYRNRK